MIPYRKEMGPSVRTPKYADEDGNIIMQAGYYHPPGMLNRHQRRAIAKIERLNRNRTEGMQIRYDLTSRTPDPRRNEGDGHGEGGRLRRIGQRVRELRDRIRNRRDHG